LAQAQVTLEQAHFLVGQRVGVAASAQRGAARVKMFAGYFRMTPFAIDQQIKTGGQDLMKKFGAEAAAGPPERGFV
jgi:hypothetical protein